MASCVARRQRRRSFHHSDAVLHRLLHLLEGTHAYLAHALARDAELVREFLERDRFFGEPARREDAPLPVVEHGERRGEGLAAAAELVACGECRLLVGMLVDQPGLSTKTLRSVAPSSTWAASYLRPSSAAFITTIAESSFQYTQDCIINIAGFDLRQAQWLTIRPPAVACPRARSTASLIEGCRTAPP